MKPDVTKHNPDPEYIRELLDRIGLDSRPLAEILGIESRNIRHYRSGKRECPYLVQFALECLAEDSED